MICLPILINGEADQVVGEVHIDEKFLSEFMEPVNLYAVSSLDNQLLSFSVFRNIPDIDPACVDCGQTSGTYIFLPPDFKNAGVFACERHRTKWAVTSVRSAGATSDTPENREKIAEMLKREFDTDPEDIIWREVNGTLLGEAPRVP